VPWILLVHSQSGRYAWPLAQARPGLVEAIIAAEPGCAKGLAKGVIVVNVLEDWENNTR
jgi:hypothetical protein